MPQTKSSTKKHTTRKKPVTVKINLDDRSVTKLARQQQEREKATAKSGKQQRAELASMIYQVMQHPALPADLKQDFYEALNEFQNTIDLNKLCHSEAALEHGFELRAEEEAKQKRRCKLMATNSKVQTTPALIGDVNATYESEAMQINFLLDSHKTPKNFKRCLEDSIVEALVRLGYMWVDELTGEIRLSPATVRIMWSHLRTTDAQCGSVAFPILIENIVHHLLNEDQGQVVFDIMREAAEFEEGGAK